MVAQGTIVAGCVELRAMTATWERARPPTFWKLPRITSRLPPALTSRSWTKVEFAIGWEMGMFRLGSTAPDVVSTAARLRRAN